MGALTITEQDRLAELEAVVERGITTFVEVGQALMEIRDSRLYRKTHSTFEDYLSVRWSMSRANGYRMIDAAKVAEILSPIGDIRNEAQIRELGPLLRDEGEQAVLRVWREAQEKYGADNVTAINLKAIIGNRVRRVLREKQVREASTYTGPLAGANHWLIHGDLLEVEIPVSIDVIICDPPYPSEFLDCYEKLSTLGLRVLPDGGSVLAMAAQAHLLEVHARLSRYLTYVWELSWVYARNAKQRCWKEHIFNAWKPVLWYAKGSPSIGGGTHGSWIRDTIMNFGDAATDKTYHHWGQSVSGMRELVKQFSKPGDTILDPFVGGGSTAIAALSAGRRFVGIDIDEEAIRTTAARITDMESDE